MSVRFATVSFQTFTVKCLPVAAFRTLFFLDVISSIAPMKISETVATAMNNHSKPSR